MLIEIVHNTYNNDKRQTEVIFMCKDKVTSTQKKIEFPL